MARPTRNLLAAFSLATLLDGSMALAAQPTQQQLVDNLKAATRAGEDAKARQAIQQLAALQPPLPAPLASSAADFLIGREQWNLARAFLDAIPQAQPGWGYVLVRRELELARGNPDRLAQLDAWTRSKAATHSPYWIHERHVFLEASGAPGRFYAELEAEIHAHPQDLELIRVYLDELRSTSEMRPLAWLPDVVKPRLAYDQLLVAQWLGASRPREALVYLQRAPTQLTQEDRDRIVAFMRRSSAMPAMAQVDPDHLYRQWVRTLMVECLHAAGRDEEAQAILVELNKEGGGNSLAMTQQAGQIQANTPLKTLEQGILKAEPENRNSHTYWSGRADYYRGRGDVSQEREALWKALALASPHKKPSNEEVVVHTMLVLDCARFLARHEGEPAAIAFLWKDYDAVNHPEHHQRILTAILSDLEHDDTHRLACDDDRLWKFLEGRPAWSYLEERLLWRMARNASPQQLPAFWKRAQDAATQSPRRAFTVGWVMNRMREPARSIPILRAACDLPNDEHHRAACFALFESCLDTHDWRAAEALWPEASRQLTEDELPDWMGRIAIAAAAAGKHDEAVRLWARKDAIDFAALRHLEDLKRLGSGPLLKAYYVEQQRLRPNSTVPATALTILGKD